MAPGDHQRGVPPVVSPRTSSNRSNAHGTASAADRSRRQYTSEASSNSPRTGTSTDGSQDRAGRQRSNGNTQANSASRNEDPPVAARARRRAQQSNDGGSQKPAGAREPRASQSASAVQRAAGGTPSDLSREASEVLNRLVISKPEVDIDREHERMAEAVPSSPIPDTPATVGSLSIVPSEGVGDAGRGGSRSRHDHANSGKKESSRSSKFGDYFLGNTLGEGEFGKVKMGWKQSGGVEVSCADASFAAQLTFTGCYQTHSPRCGWNQ